MKDTILKLKAIKEKFKAAQTKLYSLKSKKSQAKYRDLLGDIRREFKTVENDLDWDLLVKSIDVRALNLMAPYAGPIYLKDAENFKLEESWYFSFNFKGDVTRYVGEFSLLEDRCGIDNLNKILIQL